MTREEAEKMESEVRETVRERVDGGFDSRAEMSEELVDYFADEYEETEIQPVLERILAEEFARHQSEQALWDGPTDCDRLDRAFAALEREQIVARQNFTCCGTCGVAEIVDEAPEMEAIGYVFYHMQDTESAANGSGLYFNYGAENEEASIAIGWRLMNALQNAGLKPEWTGEITQRVFVPMNWKKRRADHTI